MLMLMLKLMDYICIGYTGKTRYAAYKYVEANLDIG